jgi:hypothetical protein
MRSVAVIGLSLGVFAPVTVIPNSSIHVGRLGADWEVSMSIELDIKLTQPSLRRQDVINTIFDTWTSLSLREASINIEDSSPDRKVLINGKCPPIEIGIDERASVRCDFYFVDGDPDQPESGLWATVAVGIRNAESTFLMTVVSLALAKVAKSTVVDEAGVLKVDEIIGVSQIERLMAITRGLNFAEAASAFASKIT